MNYYDIISFKMPERMKYANKPKKQPSLAVRVLENSASGDGRFLSRLLLSGIER